MKRLASTILNLPSRIRRSITSRFIQRLSDRSGIVVALYDPKTDLLRFSADALEATSLLQRGIIADAVPWMAKVRRYISPGAIVFDVGGFRGITSQWFSRVGRQVFVFEPMPENAESIRSALKVRDITNVSVHELALSDKAGTGDLHIYASRGHNSLGRVRTSSKYVRSIQVSMSTLDEFAKAHRVDRIDFLKIDVEGFELEVLNGAKNLLAAKRIGAILFEANRPVLKSIGKTAMPIYELLTSYSYTVTDLDGKMVEADEVDQCEFGDFLARSE